jgi:hypothetical protein
MNAARSLYEAVVFIGICNGGGIGVALSLGTNTG